MHVHHMEHSPERQAKSTGQLPRPPLVPSGNGSLTGSGGGSGKAGGGDADTMLKMINALAKELEVCGLVVGLCVLVCLLCL